MTTSLTCVRESGTSIFTSPGFGYAVSSKLFYNRVFGLGSVRCYQSQLPTANSSIVNARWRRLVARRKRDMYGIFIC